MQQIKTYPEMNKQIKDILRISGEAVDLYAAKRIEELEAEVERLKAENVRLVAVSGAGYEKLVRALRLIAEESEDLGSVECAQEALKSIVIGGERDAIRA